MFAFTEQDASPRARDSIVDRIVFASVLAVWLGGLIATHLFIATYASRTPVADDVSLFSVTSGRMHLPDYLWSLHNEHRLPIPKLVQYALYRLTGDIRSGMYVEAEIYAAIALACILVARKVRGSSRPWDALFPLMWLEVGNSENLMLGFQVCIAIPMACVCAVFFMSVLSPARLSPSRALASGLALLALPMCGGAGMLYAPALSAWMAWLGWRNLASAGDGGRSGARERTGARLYLAFAAATIGLVLLYMIGFHRPEGTRPDFDAAVLWRTTLGTMSIAFGPSYEQWWPASGWIIVILVSAFAFAIARRAFSFTSARRAFPFTVARTALRAHAQDVVAVGTLAVLGACITLAVGIAYGRPAAIGHLLIANRYVPLVVPLFVTLSLGALCVLGPRTRELALAASFVAMAAATPFSIEYAHLTGNMRRQESAWLDGLVGAGASPEVIRAYYSAKFLHMSERVWWPLDYFARQRLPPFDRIGDGGSTSFDPGASRAMPFETESGAPPMLRMLDGEFVYCVGAGTTLRFARAAEHGTLRGSFGAPRLLVEQGLFPALRVRAASRDGDGREHDIGELVLDPVHVAGDRGMHSVEFRWEPGAAGTVLLRFESLDQNSAGPARSWLKARDLQLQ